MTEGRILNEVRALHALIMQNYNNVEWREFPTETHRKSIQKLQILLGFPNNKAGRNWRLDTLVTILPILNNDGSPFEVLSTKVFNLAEIYALLDWLENGGAAALDVIKHNNEHWSRVIRTRLGYVTRP